MRRHVQAVGEQRHRTKGDAAGNLADHHERGEADHGPCLALVMGMEAAEKIVPVLPSLEGVRMHGSSFGWSDYKS